jgi:acetyl esterase/lipase
VLPTRPGQRQAQDDRPPERRPLHGVAGFFEGSSPVVLEDCLAAYRALLDQGVDAASIAFAGVPHVFQAFVDTLDEAGQALDRAALFLTQHLNG